MFVNKTPIDLNQGNIVRKLFRGGNPRHKKRMMQQFIRCHPVTWLLLRPPLHAYFDLKTSITEIEQVRTPTLWLQNWIMLFFFGNYKKRLHFSLSLQSHILR